MPMPATVPQPACAAGTAVLARADLGRLSAADWRDLGRSLGGKAVELLSREQNNFLSTLQ